MARPRENSVAARKSARAVRDPRQQARSHAQEREDHRLSLLEDYLQVIADLIDTEGEARVVAIAQRFGVSHVAALHTVERLQREGLATAKPRRAVFLTDEGRRRVELLRHRYEVVVRFLISIGISEDVAHVDAEGIEHHVHAETLSAFERLTHGRPRSDKDRPS
jgi:DtxR family manganese transport transcriptional regulator